RLPPRPAPRPAAARRVHLPALRGDRERGRPVRAAAAGRRASPAPLDRRRRSRRRLPPPRATELGRRAAGRLEPAPRPDGPRAPHAGARRRGAGRRARPGCRIGKRRHRRGDGERGGHARRARHAPAGDPGRGHLSVPRGLAAPADGRVHAGPLPGRGGGRAHDGHRGSGDGRRGRHRRGAGRMAGARAGAL
ncbi:MAG: hypothetical protein AVDCRST_MAG89-2159, partial [uncultured Gemmatimonadetes bacterium]